MDWYHIGVEAMPELARNILEKVKNPVLKGEQYEIDFSRCLLVTRLSQQLEELAKKDFGPVNSPEMKHGIKKFRNRFFP